MKVDGIAESLLVAEPPRPCLHRLDPAVDAFSMTVISVQDHGVDNAPQVLLQCGRHLLHGCQATARHPVDQAFPALHRPRPVLVVPQLRRKVFHCPGTSRFQRRVAQRGKGSSLVPAHVGRTPQPLVLGAFELRIPGFEQLPMLITTHLINAFAEVLGNMEAVESNLAIRVLNGVPRCLDIGRPHVHTDGFDTVELLSIQLLIEAAKTTCQAVFGNVQNRARFLLGHHRDVIMPLAIGGFVNAQSLRGQRLPARQTPPNGPLQDAVHRIPAQPQALRHRTDGCGLEPVDHQRFKQGSKAAARLSPRDVNCDHAVFITFHSRHVCHQDGLQLAGIQVTPAPRPSVVAWADLPALRALQLAAAMLHVNLHLVVCKRHIHRGDLPRLLDAQNLAVKLCIFHEDKANLPTRFGEGPKN